MYQKDYDVYEDSNSITIIKISTEFENFEIFLKLLEWLGGDTKCAYFEGNIWKPN